MNSVLTRKQIDAGLTLLAWRGIAVVAEPGLRVHVRSGAVRVREGAYGAPRVVAAGADFVAHRDGLVELNAQAHAELRFEWPEAAPERLSPGLERIDPRVPGTARAPRASRGTAAQNAADQLPTKEGLMTAMRFTILSFLALILVPLSDAYSREGGYAAMRGVGPVQQVFDFRVGDPGVAVAHLNLIHSMLDDPSMTHEGRPPATVVVLIGPSVKLVASGETGIAPRQKAAVQEKVSSMAEDGVRFEICMTTVDALGIPAESVQDEVVQVENGWISVVGYQHQGYALVAN